MDVTRVPWSEANIKEFWLTILSEAKRPQTQCLSPEGEFWVCSEANSRMVQNYFQRAKGNPGNRPHSMEAKKQRSRLLEIVYPIKSNIYKDTPMKTQEAPVKMVNFHLLSSEEYAFSVTHYPTLLQRA